MHGRPQSDEVALPNCPGQDLGTANFTAFDLRFADLAGANFTPPSCQGVFGQTTVCPGTDFTSADLDHADVANAVFSFCCGTACEPVVGTTTLSGASLEHVDAADATFADLSGLDLRYADLMGATVEFFGGSKGSDLTGANLSQTTVPENDVGFANSVLRRTDFSGADVAGLSFDGAALSARTDFDGSEIQNSNFMGTRLVPVDRTVPASSPSGAVVKWRTPAESPGATPGACSPASGSLFPVAVTTVTCSIDGGPGLPNVGGPNTASGTFTVTVQ